MMNKLMRIACLALLVLYGSPCLADDVGARCRADLEDIHGFMEPNDAGYVMEARYHGRMISEAYELAQLAAPQATQDTMCEKILRNYLWTIRKEHLALLNNREFAALARSAAGGGSAPGGTQGDERNAPGFRELDKDTILLRFPSFDQRWQDRIADLLKAHRAELASHKHWIVDIAGNSGGVDEAYAPLLPWLLDEESLGNNREWLVTPANISANEAACDLFVQQQNCRENANAVLATMRKAPNRKRVNPYADTINYGGPEQREAHQPERVAVMMGGLCAGACENFLRQVRSSFRVKLLGQPGEDVAWLGLPSPNLRRHDLPSGKRVLMYLTSNWVGPTGLPVVEHVIEPDLILPETFNRLEGSKFAEVQRWLAGIPFEAKRPFTHMVVRPPAHRLQ
jgi:hypothetical protein